MKLIVTMHVCDRELAFLVDGHYLVHTLLIFGGNVGWDILCCSVEQLVRNRGQKLQRIHVHPID